MNQKDLNIKTKERERADGLVVVDANMKSNKLNLAALDDDDVDAFYCLWSNPIARMTGKEDEDKGAETEPASAVSASTTNCDAYLLNRVIASVTA